MSLNHSNWIKVFRMKTGRGNKRKLFAQHMNTGQFEWLELILDLLNNPEPADPEHEFQCDKYTLHSLHVITLDQLGRSNEALPEQAEFATKNFPSVDESAMNLHEQAALCAKRAKSDAATLHAENALEMHDKIWGGGKDRFEAV